MNHFIVTFDSREHALQAPEATHPDNTPTLREIANSLALINRYTGHTRRPFSVAEHSLLVCMFAEAECVPAAVAFAALMHDAHECITGDTSSPVKAVLGDTWAAFEWMHQRHLLEQFGALKTYLQHKDSIKRWDLMALATERRDVTYYCARNNRPWPVLDTAGQEVPAEPIDLNSRQRQINNHETWAWLFENKASLLMEKALTEWNELRNAAQTATGALPA